MAVVLDYKYALNLDNNYHIKIFLHVGNNIFKMYL